MSLSETFGSLWEVILFGALFGAGLPAIFGLGMHALSVGTADATGHVRPTPIAFAGAILCFAVVGFAVICGILLISQHFLASTFGINVF